MRGKVYDVVAVVGIAVAVMFVAWGTALRSANAQAPPSITWTDTEGHVTKAGEAVVVSFTPVPRTLHANEIGEQLVNVRVPDRKYRRVSSFLGVDQGNLGEFAIDVYADDGTPVYHRSTHKETVADYEAWDRVLLARERNLKFLTVHLLGHLTGPPGSTGRVEFELLLE